jgi:hypothetical protein
MIRVWWWWRCINIWFVIASSYTGGYQRYSQGTKKARPKIGHFDRAQLLRPPQIWHFYDLKMFLNETRRRSAQLIYLAFNHFFNGIWSLIPNLYVLSKPIIKSSYILTYNLVMGCH